MAMTLQQLAERIGASVRGGGDSARSVSACAPIDVAGAEAVTFLANAKYAPFLQTTQAAAVIVGPDVEAPPALTLLVAEDPYFAFRNAMIALHGFRRHPQPMDAAASGVSRLALVHPSARLGRDCIVHPHAVIEAGAVAGDRCVFYPGAYLGVDSCAGDECVLYPNAVVYEHCVLGHRVTLHANCVVGNDGFGYATHKGVHHKIPQAGVVVLEDDVELGAGCAIERAAMGETRIGKGTKFADLISIGHGTTIGAGCLFVSLVGVAGSVDVGDYVVLGGQVGIAGHLRVGNQVQVAAKSGVMADVPDGAKIGGIPAIELDQAKRNVLVSLDLYGLAQRVRKLERELAQLRGGKPA